jgi:hypothetical protein
MPMSQEFLVQIKKPCLCNADVVFSFVIKVCLVGKGSGAVEEMGARVGEWDGGLWREELGS